MTPAEAAAIGYVSPFILPECVDPRAHQRNPDRHRVWTRETGSDTYGNLFYCPLHADTRDAWYDAREKYARSGDPGYLARMLDSVTETHPPAAPPDKRPSSAGTFRPWLFPFILAVFAGIALLLLLL